MAHSHLDCTLMVVTPGYRSDEIKLLACAETVRWAKPRLSI
jgi:hypothetical protein